MCKLVHWVRRCLADKKSFPSPICQYSWLYIYKFLFGYKLFQKTISCVDFKKNLVNQMVAYNPNAQIRSCRNTDKISMQDQVATTHVLQKLVAKGKQMQKHCFLASMVGKNLTEPSQVNSVLIVELINLFHHQHQPEIAFNCISLMECQQSIGSQNTNNDQQ